MSRQESGIVTISNPLPSPVRFIISSSAALSVRREQHLAAREHDRVQKLLSLQPRTEVEVKIERMHAEALFGVGQDLVLAPGVRHASGKRDHPAQSLDLVRQRPLSIDRQSRVSRLQIAEEMGTVFGNDLDGIGRQQLIVAKRCGNGAGVRIIFAAGLDVVAAVAGRLEAVNTHDLISGQPGGQGHTGVSALELIVALRPLRREFEFAFRRGKKVGDHRHIDPLCGASGLSGLRGFGGPL